MTETQAKSGSAGAPTTPVDEDAASGGTPPTGRAAVGRAAVPAEAASPKFTRAPGMAPPPEGPQAEPEPGAAAGGSRNSAGGSGGAGGAGGTGGAGAGSPVASSATGKAQVAAPSGAPTKPSDSRPASGSASVGTATPGRSPVHPMGSPGGPGSPGTLTRPGGAGGSGGPGAGGQASGTATVAGSAVGGAAVGAARVTEAVRAARTGSAASASTRGPRRARLNLKRIDPWSVMKFSFAVSLVLFIVVIVATSVLYLALDAMGVFETVNSGLGDLISAGGGQEASTFRITAKGVIGTSALIGLVNVVLFTALCTLGAFIYNVCADLVGGVELTLAERD
jgi:hypothetical protein